MTSRVAVAGYITAGATLIMIATLAALAWGAGIGPSPKVSVFVALIILTGISSLLMMGAPYLLSRLEWYGQQRWWRGYSAAVEDLKMTSNVVRMPRKPRSEQG